MAYSDENKQNKKEDNSMINLWIFRIKLGLGTLEQVPTVYRMDVYVGCVEQGIVVIEDIPAEYRDRVRDALAQAE